MSLAATPLLSPPLQRDGRASPKRNPSRKTQPVPPRARSLLHSKSEHAFGGTGGAQALCAEHRPDGGSPTPAERRTLGILFAALVIFAAGLTIGILWARSPDQPKLLTSASAATTTTGSATSAPLPTATEASATAGPKTTASPSAEPSQSPTVARTAEPSSKAIAPETSASSQVSAQPKPSAQPTTSGNGIWMMNQGQKR
jgi:hypothetical protein